MASGIYGLRLLGQPRVRRLALGLIVGLVLIARLIQFVGWAGGAFWGYDFSAYWQAAANLLHGLPPYVSAQLAGPYAAQQQFLYLYPPPLAAALTPLAATFGDYRAAAGIWALIGLVLLLASVMAIARSESLGERFELLRGNGRWWLIAAALVFPPIAAELAFGNVHLEILGLLTLAWLGLRRRSPTGDVVAGAAIGAAALIKVFPGLLIVWLLLTRRFRAATAAVGSVLILALLALPITGLQPWLDYPIVLANLGSPTYTTDALAPIVWLTPYLGFDVARAVVDGLGLVLVAVVAVVAARHPTVGPGPRTAASGAPQAAGFGAAVVTTVLVAPAVYQNYLAIFVLPLVLGLAAGVRLRWLALAYLLMWGGEAQALGDLSWVVSRGLPTLGALLLLSLLVATAIDATGGVRIPVDMTGRPRLVEP